MNQIIYERILKNSSHLLLSKGIRHISVMDLANASDVSLRTFYKYFESKEAIVEYIISEGLKGDRITLKTAIKEYKNPLDAYVVFSKHTYFNLKNMCTEFFSDLSKYFPKQYDLIQSFLLKDAVNFYVYMIAEGIKLGFIRKNINKNLCAIYLAESAVNSLFNIFIERKEYTKEQVFIQISRIMVYGLCTKKGMDRFNKAASKYFPELIKD